MVKKYKVNYEVDKNICAPCQLKKNKNSSFKTCYSKESLIKIAKIWNKENPNSIIDYDKKSKKNIWEHIQKKLSGSCKKDEFCWKKQDFIKKLKDIEIELYTFKPNYPKAWGIMKGEANASGSLSVQGGGIISLASIDNHQIFPCYPKLLTVSAGAIYILS